GRGCGGGAGGRGLEGRGGESNPRLGQSRGTEESPPGQNRHDRHTDDAERRTGKRLDDERCDHAREDGEVIPRVARQSRGRGDQSDDSYYGERHGGPPPLSHLWSFFFCRYGLTGFFGKGGFHLRRLLCHLLHLNRYADAPRL